MSGCLLAAGRACEPRSDDDVAAFPKLFYTSSFVEANHADARAMHWHWCQHWHWCWQRPIWQNAKRSSGSRPNSSGSRRNGYALRTSASNIAATSFRVVIDVFASKTERVPHLLTEKLSPSSSQRFAPNRYFRQRFVPNRHLSPAIPTKSSLSPAISTKSILIASDSYQVVTIASDSYQIVSIDIASDSHQLR